MRQLRKFPPGETGIADLNVRQALVVGCAQALAILPGISRSGATIVAGSRAGLKAEAAAEFSFFSALPLIAGAAALELLDCVQDASRPPGDVLPELGFGFLVSALTGYLSLRLLIGLLRRGKFVWFSNYLYVVGTAVVLWQLVVLCRG